MKLKTTIPCTLTRRNHTITITPLDGSKPETYTPPGMDPSPCMKAFLKHPSYRSARRSARRIARSQWDSYWWRREYLSHNGNFSHYSLNNLLDYITLRLILEGQ